MENENPSAPLSRETGQGTPALLYSPFTLSNLHLRNRLVRSAAFEGMCPGGEPSESIFRYHHAVASGGIGMSTLAYVAIRPDGLSSPWQMWMRSEIVADLRRFTEVIHREGAAASIQLGHAGLVADTSLIHARPIAPSARFNAYDFNWSRAMSIDDIARVTDDFGKAALMARECGFDAVEIHAGHGYLISQFLSPATNRRDDGYGGPFERRSRFLREVVRHVRSVLGAEFPVLFKMNLRDGFPGGLEIDDAIRAAQLLENEGASALVLSGGFVRSSPNPMYILRGEVPLEDTIKAKRKWAHRVGIRLLGKYVARPLPFEEGYFVADALRVRQAVTLPLVAVGGMRSRSGMESALAHGLNLIAMARPLIMEPDLPRRMLAGQTASRCTPCNRCLVTMDLGATYCPLAEESPWRI